MEILNIIKEINSTNSNLSKQEIIKKYTTDDFFTKILIYTYDTSKQYNVTPKTIKKFKNKEEIEHKTYENIFSLLDDLNERVITGHCALKSVLEFIKKYPENETLMYLVLDRNLKIRIGVASINKIYGKEIINTFEPVLSNKHESKMVIDDNWYISRKLDGVRCLIHIKNNKAVALSRNGKPLYNLDNIISKIPKIKENVFLDGEVIFIQNDKENFTKTIEIVRKSITKADTGGLYFKIFDIIPEDEFFSKSGNSMFLERQERLNKLFNGNERIKIVQQYKYSIEQLSTMTEKVKQNGWEGLMIRKNAEYKGKRTNDLLKLKKFHDEEFKVIKTINDNLRFINKKTGLEETIMCLSAVSVDVNGVECKVGSGFSLKQRKLFYKSPDKIMDKYISVKYFEKTDDGSLRFPIFLSIRDYE